MRSSFTMKASKSTHARLGGASPPYDIPSSRASRPWRELGETSGVCLLQSSLHGRQQSPPRTSKSSPKIFMAWYCSDDSDNLNTPSRRSLRHYGQSLHYSGTTAGPILDSIKGVTISGRCLLSRQKPLRHKN